MEPKAKENPGRIQPQQIRHKQVEKQMTLLPEKGQDQGQQEQGHDQQEQSRDQVQQEQIQPSQRDTHITGLVATHTVGS